MDQYSKDLLKASKLIREAEYILVGAGAGLSYSGGLDYSDPDLFKKLFPEFCNGSVATIFQAISRYWSVKNNNWSGFWGYWATHLKRIRYDFPATETYLNLLDLVKNKNYFVITTNVDGQILKAGFNSDIIFAPQGEYKYFQCRKPCREIIYDNKEMIQAMLENMDREKSQIQEQDIPLCPECGDYLVKNLRIDNSFVEAPHMEKRKDYVDFINCSVSGRLVLLELGVGFNTPGIIRWPFEKIAKNHPDAVLIRINLNEPDASEDMGNKMLSINYDIKEVLKGLLEMSGNEI